MRRNELILSIIALIWIGVLFAFFIRTEKPLGSLEGIVVAGENGKPIKDAEVSLSAEAWDFERAYKAKTDGKGHFLIAGIPVGDYFLYCQSSAHYLAEGRERYVKIREGETRHIVLRLSRLQTSISIWADKSVFTTGQSVRVWASGYAPEEKLKLCLYRFKLEELPISKLFELGTYIYPWRQPGTSTELSLPMELVRSWEEKITRDPEDTFNWGCKIPPLSPGLYKLEASSGEVKSSFLFLVTSLALVLKQDGEKSLIWATDLEKGFPLAGVDIIAQKGKEIVTGRTDSNGLWEGKLLGPGKIVGRMGPSYAFLTVWEYDIPRGGETSYKIYTYTERPIYRPGQTVYFKTIVREMKNGEYRIPKQLELRYEVRDEDGNILHIAELKTNKFGSCWGSFKIPQTAKPGTYTISASCEKLKAYEASYFNVSVYRKPEVDVKLKPNKERYLIGETAKVEVEARYLFGVPVTGATVDYEVYRSPYAPYFEEGLMREEEFGEEEYGEMVRMATTKTDNLGKATISIPLEREPGRMRDYFYTVKVTVTDASNRTAEASTNFLAARSPSTLRLSLERTILQVGQKIDVNISYSTPMKGKRKIKVILYKLYWEGKKAKKKERAVWRLQMKDGERRKIQPVIGEEGEYELIGKEEDAILDTISLVVLPSLSEGRYPLTRPLKYPCLLSDRASYRRGDEALIILDLPYKTNVLLTYEGRKLFKYEVRSLDKGRHLMRIRNLGSWGYLLVVEATIVRKGGLIRESATLSINPPRLKLKFALETNKKVYEPRSDVFCKVKVEDEKGKPLKSELSVAVVDEAIFKIMEENADEDIRSYFTPSDTLGVSTRWSGEMIYLGAVSKAFAPQEVRQYFPDTAFWLPSLLTDENGFASFSFRLPDNITSWRITVVGNTLSNIFGASKGNIIAQKPLFVRLAMPTFLRQGDTTIITGIVHNRTEEKQTIRLELSAQNIRIIGDKEKELVVEAKREGRAVWKVKVENEISATITLYALARSGLKDAMKLTMPILPFGLPKEKSKSGQTDKTVVESIRIDEDAIPSTVKLNVSLSPSVTSSLFSALEYLAQYPYGCTEQTVDTFLPDVAIYLFLKERGMRNEKLEKELPDMISKGIFRLYYLQHPDGGWGWTENDVTLPWTTAYALWGLWEANKMGFPVNQNVLEGGKDTLLKMMEAQLKVEVVPKLGDREKDEWLLAFYVLTSMGEDITPFLDYFLQILPTLSPKGKALLTLSYLNLGRRDKAEKVFQSLWADRQENGDICFWKGEYEGAEETAMALRAMLKLQQRNFACVKAVNYIVTLRRGREWFSTKDTALIILSLLEFSKIWEDLNPHFRLYLQVNGKTVKQITFTPADVFKPPVELNLDMNQLKKGENEIRLLKQGKGKLFYSFKLEEVLKREAIQPDKGFAGIEIKRVYRPLSVSAKEGLIWKAGRPSEEFRKGKLFEAEVKLKFKKKDIPFNYFILEEPLPPGCEFNGISDDSEYSDYDELGDKVAFYLPYIGREKEITLRYRLRAETEGVYRVMPTFIYNMYFPQFRSVGNSNRVTIR